MDTAVSNYPTVDESFDRLHRAGWSVGDVHTSAGWLVSDATLAPRRLRAARGRIVAWLPRIGQAVPGQVAAVRLRFPGEVLGLVVLDQQLMRTPVVGVQVEGLVQPVHPSLILAESKKQFADFHAPAWCADAAPHLLPEQFL
jgi:hypothetical protein